MYLQAIMEHARLQGHDNFLLAGVPNDFHFADHCGHLPCNAEPELVRFGQDTDFQVVGMSDVMPYPSARFCDLTAEDLARYEACFDARLRSAIQRWQPDIIHAHHLWLLTSLARQRFPEIPMVASCHGSDLRQFHTCCHLQPQVLYGCRQVDAICALNEGQKEQISQEYEIDQQRIHVVGAGFNSALFQAPQTDQKPTDPTQIVYVGKLSRAKGVPWLIKALQRLKQKRWHFHLIGDSKGEEKNEIIALARQLGNSVTLHGSLKPDQLAEILKKSHLFILPSFFEGVPLVVLEALACGCRVVTTNLPGIKEVFGPLTCDWLQRVELPEMETIDHPHPDSEEDFIERLQDKITAQLTAIENNPTLSPPQVVQNVIHNYEWESTFCRIEKVYEQVLRLNQ
nr:glycosyltransferase family 4 protein [Desulfuromonas acetoxidans]